MLEEKVRENRLRRMAERQGLTHIESRRRDPLAADYGKYYLHDKDKPVGAERGLSQDEVEAALTDPASSKAHTYEKETVSDMFADNIYTKLNNVLIDAGMDPAKAMHHPTYVSEFRSLCLEVGTTPAAVCEAAGL